MKNLKRPIAFFLLLIMLFSTTTAFAVRHKKRDIALNGIIVNDHIVYSDVEPYIKNSRTFVPIRFIAEELGYDVKWDDVNRKVIMTEGDTKVELKIGSADMLVNGRVVKLDAPAEIRDDRTFVPLRAIAEAFGEKVDFSEDYRAVYIGAEPKYNKFYKVVYYYTNGPVLISNYTINIATYKMDINGNLTRFETAHDLINSVCDDFVDYEINGRSQYGISIYKENTQSKNTGPKTNSSVPKDRQLKDEYYVAPTNDPLVGSWFGRLFYDASSKYSTVDYVYIEALGNNKYKLTKRTLLESDQNSQVITSQYGYYDPQINGLVVSASPIAYDGTGHFKNRSVYSLETTYYLENNNTRISWGEKGSQYFLDKY